MKTDYIEGLLASEELVVRVIKDFAELEWNLDLLLTRYFTAQERYDEFFDIIVGSLNFNQKIEIFAKMSLPQKGLSTNNAARSLKKLRKLRNLLAHTYEWTQGEIQKISTDNELARILANYPKSYDSEIINTKIRLRKIVMSYIRNSWKKNGLISGSSQGK